MAFYSNNNDIGQVVNVTIALTRESVSNQSDNESVILINRGGHWWQIDMLLNQGVDKIWPFYSSHALVDVEAAQV